MPRVLRISDERLFGRARELGQLQQRVQTPGVTFLIAPPRMGKSTLIRWLAADLEQADWNIGYHESSGETSDLLLLAVRDLYERWLGNSTKAEQARVLWQKYRSQLVGRIGIEFGRWLTSIGSISIPAISGLFNTLERANKDLSQGEFGDIPRNTYNDAFELVQLVAVVTEQPVLLILDAWDQSAESTKARDRAAIEQISKRLTEWPGNFHILISIRDAPQHRDDVEFAQSHSRMFASANAMHLGELDLTASSSQQEVLAWLSENIPATETMESAWLIEAIRNPAVLDHWRWGAPTDETQLRELADQANAARFDYLIDALQIARNRAPESYEIATALALLPEMTTPERWQDYRQLLAVLFGGSDDDVEEALEVLEVHRIISRRFGVCQFGHTLAYESVKRFVLNAPEAVSMFDPTPISRRVATSLIEELAAQLSAVPGNPDYSIALGAQAFMADVLGVDEEHTLLACLVLPLVGIDLTEDVQTKLLTQAPALAERFAPASPLLTSALVAIQQTAMLGNNTKLTRRVVDISRGISLSRPDQPVVESFAESLFNAIHAAVDQGDTASRDDLLTELRQLSADHGTPPFIVVQESRAIRTMVRKAAAQAQPTTCIALLAGLRALARAHPDNAEVRARLAIALSDTLLVVDESNRAEHDRLLAELRRLYEHAPGEVEPAGHLALTLFNMSVSRSDRGLSNDDLVDELRSMAARHPDVPEVIESLAMALHNRRSELTDSQSRRVTLEELRALHEAHPENVILAVRLLMGIVDLAEEALAADDGTAFSGAWKDAMLIARKHADDQAIDGQIVRLMRLIVKFTSDSDLRVMVLGELRAAVLNVDQPGLYTIEQYVGALKNALARADFVTNAEERERALSDLRDLAEAYPNESVIVGDTVLSHAHVIGSPEINVPLTAREAAFEELKAFSRPGWIDLDISESAGNVTEKRGGKTTVSTLVAVAASALADALAKEGHSARSEAILSEFGAMIESEFGSGAGD